MTIDCIILLQMIVIEIRISLRCIPYSFRVSGSSTIQAKRYLAPHNYQYSNGH